MASLFPEVLCCRGKLTLSFFMLTLPGLFASSAIVGNIHAYPLWIAAIVNAGLYYALGLLIWRLLAGKRPVATGAP